MKSILQIIALVLALAFCLYTADYFATSGRYFALATSQISGFFANPHKAIPVGIEVISDQKFAKQDQLMALVLGSFNQFRPLGIDFQLKSWRIKNIDPGQEEAQVTSGQAKYVIVLSNNAQLIHADHVWHGVAAYADPQKKIIVVSVEDRALLQPGKLASTIQHELGHLFYAEHDEQTTAYVMSPVENSSTIWSEKSRDTIIKMKYRW